MKPKVKITNLSLYTTHKMVWYGSGDHAFSLYSIITFFYADEETDLSDSESECHLVFSEATKQLLVDHPPHILCIHLKRYLYNVIVLFNIAVVHR